MYLNYEEYQSFGGTLDITAFNNFSFCAEGIINRYSYNRLTEETEITETVKRVMFNLISIAEKQEQTLSTYGTVTSRSNDGVSESYSAMSPDEIYQNLNNQVDGIIKQGLSGVRNSKGHRLLFRGIYPDE